VPLGRKQKTALSLVAALCVACVCLAADPERAVMPVSINEVDQGTWLLVLVDGDVLVRVLDLEKAQLTGFAGRRESLLGEEFVDLRSLAPEVRYLLDPEALTLKLTVPPSYFSSTLLSLANGAPPGIVYSKNTSAFFNYALSGGSFSKIEGFTEAGVSMCGDLLLYSSAARSAEGELIRGMTNFTIDDRAHLRRWVVGDAYASAGGLGGALFLAGASVSREFSLNPYFNRYPTLSFSGAVTTPSRVDVYVNGAIVRTEQLPPGTYDLSNISVPAGTGSAELVIRDAFGQQQTLTHPFYAATAVLARGLQEYTYNLGFRRNNVGTSGTDYEQLSFLGQHRVGLTDAVTAGFRLEGDRDRVSGGPGLAVGLTAGELDAELGISTDHGNLGYAGAAAYRYNGRPLNFGFLLEAKSPRYVTLSLTTDQDRARLGAGAFFGAQLGRRVGLTLQHTTTDMRDGPTRRLTSLLGNVMLTQHANLVFSAASSRIGNATDHQVYVGVSFFLKANMTASASYQRQAGLGTAAVDLQKPLPVGTGYGFRVGGSDGDGERAGGGLVQYQGPYGRYEASYARVGDQAATNVTITGGFVAIGGTVVPTRAVGESFALIRIPDVQGVTGFQNNQDIGRTSRRGNLLVPDLLPYYGNRVSIAGSDLPLDYDIAATDELIAPPHRGGAVVSFPVKRIRSVSGTVVIEVNGEDVVPTFGELEATAGERHFESPLGEGGEFYLENVQAGPVQATIRFRDVVCSFVLEVPDSDQAFLRLPPARCVASGVKESEP
jgi:outer membrane usher protein